MVRSEEAEEMNFKTFKWMAAVMGLVFAAGLLVGLMLQPATAEAHASWSCNPYLAEARRHVKKAREAAWVGVDGNRLKAVEGLADYLGCLKGLELGDEEFGPHGERKGR